MAADANFWAEFLADRESDDEIFEGFSLDKVSESDFERWKWSELENSEVMESDSDEDEEIVTDPTFEA